MDIQLVEVEPGHLMARAPGTGAQSITQHGRIALAAGTSIENEDFLAHGVPSCAA